MKGMEMRGSISERMYFLQRIDFLGRTQPRSSGLIFEIIIS